MCSLPSSLTPYDTIQSHCEYQLTQSSLEIPLIENVFIRQGKKYFCCLFTLQTFLACIRPAVRPKLVCLFCFQTAYCSPAGKLPFVFSLIMHTQAHRCTCIRRFLIILFTDFFEGEVSRSHDGLQARLPLYIRFSYYYSF